MIEAVDASLGERRGAHRRRAATGPASTVRRGRPDGVAASGPARCSRHPSRSSCSTSSACPTPGPAARAGRWLGHAPVGGRPGDAHGPLAAPAGRPPGCARRPPPGGGGPGLRARRRGPAARRPAAGGGPWTGLGRRRGRHRRRRPRGRRGAPRPGRQPRPPVRSRRARAQPVDRALPAHRAAGRVPARSRAARGQARLLRAAAAVAAARPDRAAPPAGRGAARTAFPRWPVEPALHDLYDLLFGLLAEVAASRCRASPRGRTAVVGARPDARRRDRSRPRERRARCANRACATGVRSAWNFVPLRYAADDALVRTCSPTGFEVGVHGLYHDGRDLGAPGSARRLPQMRSYAARWRAAGFRSPAPNRGWEHDAAPRLRPRQLVPRHGPVRARRGRLLLVAADSRRHGRAARHARPGPHAVRDPSPRRASRVVRRRPMRPRRAAGWRS